MEKIIESKCSECGCTFEYHDRGKKRRKCDNCREKTRKLYDKNKNKQRKEERKKIAAMNIEKRKARSLSRIAAEAKKNGMTYGQYVAVMENKELINGESKRKPR